jgi:hypothetical protein
MFAGALALGTTTDVDSWILLVVIGGAAMVVAAVVAFVLGLDGRQRSSIVQRVRQVTGR